MVRFFQRVKQNILILGDSLDMAFWAETWLQDEGPPGEGHAVREFMKIHL